MTALVDIAAAAAAVFCISLTYLADTDTVDTK